MRRPAFVYFGLHLVEDDLLEVVAFIVADGEVRMFRVGNWALSVRAFLDVVQPQIIELFSIHARTIRPVLMGVNGSRGALYNFYCSVPGHEDAGMKGTLVVA